MTRGQVPADAPEHDLGDDSRPARSDVAERGDQEEVQRHVGEQAPARRPCERSLVVRGAQRADECVVREADRET